jgi:hypothetical protein
VLLLDAAISVLVDDLERVKINAFFEKKLIKIE